MYQRILAPIDGSATSLRGLREAIQLAKEQNAVLRLIHIVDESMIAMDPTAVMVWSSVIQQLREGGLKILQEGQALAAEQGLGAQTKMVEGVQRGAAAAILEEAAAWPADLIVMGTHGRRGLSRLVMGSDAQGVLHGATMPLLLVRGTA